MRYLLSLSLILNLSFGQERHLYKIQTADDEYDKYTSVGNLGMTITNYGILGNGWNRMEDGSINPSCEYKQYTEIPREQIEHFSYSALWVGGIVNGQRRVSTAIVDGVFESGEAGFELFANSPITIQSSISSTTQDSMAQYYSPNAISHQDMICDFKDYGITTSDNLGIQGHTPLGLDIHLESYAWNYSYADAFVILNYTFTNASPDTVHDIYAGIWVDASVANFNYTDKYTPGGGFTWYDNLNGFDESVDEKEFKRNIGYQYDANGDDGWAESYVGISALGGSIPYDYLNTNYFQWVWTNSNNSDYPAYSMPITDEERYDKMSSSVPKGSGSEYTSDGYPASENSWMLLLSAGPVGNEHNADTTSWKLAPGASCNIAFTVVCGLWASGADGNSNARRRNLHVNYDWAQQAYDGEDKNRNNQLDPGEDINENGIIDRYILPAPPPSPNMEVVVESEKVTLYWQKNAESFLDPISQDADFEGYRVYGARKTANDELGEFSLLSEIDLKNEIGYNTGFSTVRIKNEFGEPDSILVNGTFYHYKFVNTNIKDGWLNYYAITAYDQGDPDANLASLESSIYSNRVYVYPGASTSHVGEWVGEPTVYPNPYKGQALWDSYGSRSKMLWFRNLPREAEIRIFSLAGDLVDIIQHDQTYVGSDIANIDAQKSPLMSGGEHAWDLITMHDQATASGLYLFTVEDKNSGEIREGKFLIIK
ncbi:MAG: hypothetical protein CMG57_07290 [Candidatus Marinimicrobia bacterium]|nr:hypothetical protein [Candidatus Neomarinimicrobiota bacterium]|tara:strand:+ start:1480 stop:3612 length:2133 start_codon:yes stop_codon:yes gene_type:complete